jgi:hypothetical protein
VARKKETPPPEPEDRAAWAAARVAMAIASPEFSKAEGMEDSMMQACRRMLGASIQLRLAMRLMEPELKQAICELKKVIIEEAQDIDDAYEWG